MQRRRQGESDPERLVFFAEQPALEPHLARPEEGAALTHAYVLTTVLRVSRSCELLPFEVRVIRCALSWPSG